MNFREAMRMSVTGTHLKEGYEEAVLNILEDENIDGPLGYEPFFEKGKLYVEKGSERKAAKVLKQSKDINKVPKNCRRNYRIYRICRPRGVETEV